MKDDVETEVLIPLVRNETTHDHDQSQWVWFEKSLIQIGAQVLRYCNVYGGAEPWPQEESRKYYLICPRSTLDEVLNIARNACSNEHFCQDAIYVCVAGRARLVGEPEEDLGEELRCTLPVGTRPNVYSELAGRLYDYGYHRESTEDGETTFFVAVHEETQPELDNVFRELGLRQ